MIKPRKPLTKDICGPRLMLVGPDESILSNGHWAIRIDLLHEGSLVKSPEYVRSYLSAVLDKMPTSSFAKMLSHTRKADKPLHQWYDTGWRNPRGQPLALFSTLEIPADKRHTEGSVVCLRPAYVQFFGADGLWGTDGEDVFTDAERAEDVSFVLMPVRPEGWVGPLLRLFKEHPEVAG